MKRPWKQEPRKQEPLKRPMPAEAAACASRLEVRENFLYDVVEGLTRYPKALSSRWFYDEEGSRIFEAIMRLPEYYPTACETRILETRRRDILDAFGGLPFHVVDLGAGNGAKTRILLNYFAKQGCLLGYAPVDVSRGVLDRLVNGLCVDHPGLSITPLVGEYFDALKDWRPIPGGRKLALFLGSNIGNFDRADAVDFLRSLRGTLGQGDGLLIGFDLRKEPARILRAYSDSAGVTARFNLNLLHRINRELGGDFHPEAFRHHALCDPVQGVARSYLVARRSQAVSIGAAGLTVHFRAGESLHTENAFKYSVEETDSMARDSGFTAAAQYLDPTGSFLDSLWLPA